MRLVERYPVPGIKFNNGYSDHTFADENRLVRIFTRLSYLLQYIVALLPYVTETFLPSQTGSTIGSGPVVVVLSLVLT